MKFLILQNHKNNSDDDDDDDDNFIQQINHHLPVQHCGPFKRNKLWRAKKQLCERNLS